MSSRIGPLGRLTRYPWKRYRVRIRESRHRPGAAEIAENTFTFFRIDGEVGPFSSILSASGV